MKTILVSAFANINTVSNNRVLSIFNSIPGEKTVVTTDFCHGEKRYYLDNEKSNPNQIHLHVPSYTSNLSIKRIWSHLCFAKKVKTYLNNLGDLPDIIYCTMPSSSSAFVCAKFCKKNNIKFVIDVIDLWPDSLLPFVKGKDLFKALLYPWSSLTQYSYKHADIILGESFKYASEAKKVNNNADVYPLYLGVDMNFVKNITNNNPVKLNKPDDEIWIAYAGRLGTSYGFDTLLSVLKKIRGNYKYKFWFVGDGVERSRIESFIIENNINAEITGYLPYNELLGYLVYCDIAINLFRKGTKVVYSYKFNDYVATNCFILNSLDGETAELVDTYKVGRNFNYSNLTLDYVLADVLANWSNYSSWKTNNYKLIEEKLDKEKIYSVLKGVFSSCK